MIVPLKEKKMTLKMMMKEKEKKMMKMMIKEANNTHRDTHCVRQIHQNYSLY
jgi:hypothetical protein